MASRLPLLAAALLFAIGVAGLVTTAPGREFGNAFLPLLEPGAKAAPPPAMVLNPVVPPIVLALPTANPSAPPAAKVVVAAVSTVTPTLPTASPTPLPTPSLHLSTASGVASDDSPAGGPMVAVAVALAADNPPPTLEPARPLMIASDGDDEAATPSVTATPTPQAPATSTATAEPSATPTGAATATPTAQ